MGKKPNLGRIPVAPPGYEHSDRSKYNRKQKHIDYDGYELYNLVITNETLSVSHYFDTLGLAMQYAEKDYGRIISWKKLKGIYHSINLKDKAYKIKKIEAV